MAGIIGMREKEYHLQIHWTTHVFPGTYYFDTDDKIVSFYNENSELVFKARAEEYSINLVLKDGNN